MHVTLAVVLGNADQVVVAVDRRTTTSRRKIESENAGKVGHAICDDASFIYCFTGLASVGRTFVTSRWLAMALYNAAQKSHRYFDIVIAFSDEATAYFRDHLKAVSASDRRLTIMFVGYLKTGQIVCSLISNFQDWAVRDHSEAQRAFSYLTEVSRTSEENPTCVQAIGQFGALTGKDEGEVRALLERRPPPNAVLQKAISWVQNVSDRPKARGTVGKRITTARLIRTEPNEPVVGYASDTVETTMPLIDQVDLRTGASRAFMVEGRLSTTAPFIHPRQHRNALCSCGSGKKYRHCHGRVAKLSAAKNTA
jgi:SEC-C motif